MAAGYWVLTSLFLGAFHLHEGKSLSTPCQGDVIIHDKSGALYGFPGMVPNSGNFYSYVHGLSNNYNPRKLKVQVTTKAGKPVSLCKVSWKTNTNAGWIYPDRDGETDQNGYCTAWLVVGTENSGVVVAAAKPGVQVTIKLAGLRQQLTMRGDNVAAAGSYFSMNIPSTADEVIGTVEPITDSAHQPYPYGTYYSFMQGYGYYLGTVPDSIIFSSWTGKDNKTKIYSVGKFAECEFSPGEGNHIGCHIRYTHVKNEKLTFFVKRQKMPDGELAISLDVQSQAYPFSGKRLHIATVRLLSQAVTFGNAGGFIEQFLMDPGSRNCLQLTPRYVKIYNVKYHVMGQPDGVYHKPTKMIYFNGVAEKYGHVCANYYYGPLAEGGGAYLGIGGSGKPGFGFAEPFGRTVSFKDGKPTGESPNRKEISML